MAPSSSRDGATREALDGGAPRAELTDREIDVARLVAAGLRNREIALRLSISTRTAESHIANIRVKLGLRSKADISRWMTERGISASIGGAWP